MDETTAGGYPPQLVAEQILNRVVLQEKEAVIASSGPRFAILLRSLSPSIYFWVMQKRADKMFADATSKTNFEFAAGAAAPAKTVAENPTPQKSETKEYIRKKIM